MRSLITPLLMLVFSLAAYGEDIRVPISPRDGKPMPALLIFGGLEEAARVLDLIHPTVPIVLASFDYPFSPPRKFEFPCSLKYAPEAKKAISATIDGIIALGEKLKARKDVDPARITLAGASFGAPFVLAAAARSDTFKGVALLHGFADIPATVTARAAPGLTKN